MNSRDIRTLLLCKIHRGHGEAYKYICSHSTPEGEMLFPSNCCDCKSYFTVGGFDALTTYKIASFDDENVTPNWMEKLAENKKNALAGMKENVSYHPIHIIANRKDDEREKCIRSFWKKTTSDTFPFLLVTFVYGVYHSDGILYEDALWEFLKRSVDSQYCSYVVYNSVDLCDLVVLWHTTDISYVLEKAMSISRDNHARKTYTFVNIPLEYGKFDPRVKPLLSEHQGCCIDNAMLRSVSSTLEGRDRVDAVEAFKNLRRDRLFVCVRGAICDSNKFNEFIISKLIDPANAPLHGSYFSINFGENDFMIAKAVSGEAFYSLLNYFLENSNEIDEACWHIFTEFQYGYIAPHEPAKINLLNNILSKEYRRTLDVYREIGKKQYSWADALLELTNIHAHIDRLPILHGPSYLIWGCLHVVNNYLLHEEPLYSDDIQLDFMLKKSRLGIESFVRAWSQLTDQITKVDDVIFHRLGNTTAIYNTLSESILELYHLFLSKLSEALILSDGVDADKAHCHSFLLAPTLSQRMRIKQVFSVASQVLSEHQVYIIEFPIDYLYSPNHFIFQLAHECLHSFGRRMRCREVRLKYMQGFMASEVLSSFADLPDQENLARVVFKKLRAEMSDLHKDDGIPSEDARMDRESVYMKTVVADMKKVVPEKILTQSMYRSLCGSLQQEQDCDILSDKSIDRWVDLSSAYLSGKTTQKNENVISLSEKINSCQYFFIECYADVMAIKLLGCSLNDYLEAFSFDDTLPEEAFSDQEAQFIQRLAIVLTAAFEDGKTLCVNDHTATLEEIASSLTTCFESRAGLADRLYECFDVLLNQERSAHYWPPQNSRAYFSANALRTVVDYLVDALKKADGSSKFFSEVQTLYSTVIKDGDFFSERYYQYIFDYHKTIRELVGE